MIGFVIGVFVGAIFGVFAMCLCVAAGNAEKAMEHRD